MFISSPPTVDLVSILVDTDYSGWAVLVQCSESGAGEPVFLSTRILSRARVLTAGQWVRVEEAVERAGAGAPFRYPVDQQNCDELDREKEQNGIDGE